MRDSLSTAVTAALARSLLGAGAMRFGSIATAAPSGLPEALWKALGKDDRETQTHLAEIEKLACSADEKARIIAAYPRAMKCRWPQTVREALRTLAAEPQAGALFERFADDCTRFDAQTAHRDLTLALSQSKRRSLPVDDVYAAMREVHALDVTLSANPNTASSSFAAAVDLLLEAPDVCERDARARDLGTLAAASGRLGVALTDFALASRPANGRPRAEAVALLKTMRENDPARRDRYATLAEPTPALDYALHGEGGSSTPTDLAKASERLAQLISLLRGGRSIVQALTLEREIARLGCDDDQKRAIREALAGRLERLSPNLDATFASALQACAGADARFRFASFERLLDVTSGPRRAAIDLQNGIEASNRTGVDLGEVFEHLVALRKADPARNEPYQVDAEAREALDEIVGAATPKARLATREALLALQQKGRNADAVTPLLRSIRAAAPNETTRTALHACLVAQLRAYQTAEDKVFVEALALAASVTATHGGEVSARYAQFDERLAQVKRPRVALTDLTQAAATAAQQGVPLETVLESVKVLRAADPAMGDRYAGFDDFGAVLPTVVAPGASVEDVRRSAELLASLQVGTRNASAALPHETALRALPGDDNDRAQVRDIYRTLLGKVSSQYDKTLIAALATVAKSGAPLAAIRGFERLWTKSGTPIVAAADLDLAVASTHASVDLEEAVDRLVALRENDPARQDRYERFASPTRALQHVLTAATRPERDARLARIVALQKRWPNLEHATTFDQRLETLKLDDASRASVRAGVLALLDLPSLRREGKKAEETVVRLLDTVDGQADAADQVKVYGAMIGVNTISALAHTDLVAVVAASRRRGLPLAEVADLAATIRKVDVLRGYSKDLDMGVSLDLAIDGVNADDRRARASSLQHLLLNMDGEAARARLGWLIAAPLPNGDLADATNKMVRLSNLSGDDAVHALYDRLQAKTSSEHPRWWQKLLRLWRPYERTMWQVTGMTRSASAALGVLEALDDAALPGEAPHQTLKRLRDLLPDDGYPINDATLQGVSRAFQRSLQPLPWTNDPPVARWKRFLAVARQTPREALPFVWSSAAAAGTETEHEARLRAWDTISRTSRSDAHLAYQALAEGLGPADAIDAVLPQMLALMGKQQAGLAAVIWRLQRKMPALSASERAAAQSLLERARNTSDAQALCERLCTPVAGEPVTRRLALLETLLQGTKHSQRSIEGYDQIVTALGAEFSDACEAFSSLLTLLGARTRAPVAVATAAVARIRELQAETAINAPDLAPAPLTDMLLALTQSLLLGSDIEKAVGQLRISEEQRRNAAMREGKGGRIEVGEREINVGGIRIRRRSDG